MKEDKFLAIHRLTADADGNHVNPTLSGPQLICDCLEVCHQAHAKPP